MHCKRVHEHAFRIRKGHAVFAQIPRHLGRIELKVHLMVTVCMLCIRVKYRHPGWLTAESTVRGFGHVTVQGLVSRNGFDEHRFLPHPLLPQSVSLYGLASFKMNRDIVSSESPI